MISINSNCSRVDAVKASANQLRIQFAQARKAGGADEVNRKLNNELQSLDAQIKTGDAKKAEEALSVARSVATQVQSASENDAPNHGAERHERRSRLDVYA